MLMQYQREGDRHLLIPAEGFAGGTKVLSLDRYEIAQHALFSGCSYRFEGEAIDGHELIDRINQKPKVVARAGIPLYLPEMHRGKTKGRTVD